MANFKPAVNRRYLFLVAGMFWLIAGMILLMLAAQWLLTFAAATTALIVVLGTGVGYIIYQFGFSNIVRKNVKRIKIQPPSVCLFAFQAWRSYLIVFIMMMFGYLIRHSPVSRLLVALIYISIGFGLLLSSLIYLKTYWQTHNQGEQ